MLKVDKLSKQSTDSIILNNITFNAKTGEITAVLGPSGSGKTTLLRCLAQITNSSSDGMLLDSIPLNSLERGKIGLVFQSFNLFPNLTIKDNLILAPIAHGIDKNHALAKAKDLLEQFGLSDKLSDHPHQLSGGQKQRIAIARALMLEPPILLFDEPTSALDPEMVHDVGNIIQSVKNPNRIIMIVTHELRLAKQIADHVLFLDHGLLIDDCRADEFFKKDSISRSVRAQKFLENFE